jgi:two-component system, OmpR family, phosphate regulon sensor histidine kinase PhoR
MSRWVWRALAVFVLLLGTVGLLIYSGTRAQGRAINQVTGYLQPLDAANLALRADFANAQALQRGYLLTREPYLLARYGGVEQQLGRGLAGLLADTTGRWRGYAATEREAASSWESYAGTIAALPPTSPALAALTSQSVASADLFYQASQLLHGQIVARSGQVIRSGQQALDRAVAWSAVLAVAVLVFVVLAGAGTIREVTRPLAGLTATLRRLTSGETTARAQLTGAAEAVEVARSLNALADESDRLRAQEAEAARLRAMARAGGIRIAEHLRPRDVLTEASRVLAEGIGADAVYLHLVEEDGSISPPVDGADQWLMPGDFATQLPAETLESFREAFRAHTSRLVQDVPGPEGDSMPPAIRDQLRRVGVVSILARPFGVGSDMLGFIVAVRRQAGHPWTPDEIGAVESIATDLGRALHHARLYDAENRLVAELKVIDRTKSDFLATVSHELRTPLTSIAGYVEILRDLGAGPLNPAQERMLETVDRNTARLRHLIEDVLTLSRIESGAFKTARMPVNMADVVAAAVTALRPAAARNDVALTLSYAGADRGLPVAGDPGQLDRVLINLLSNAVKFTPAGGEIRVAASGGDGMAVVEITDTGVGIPAGDQKGLFTRFFRASNAVDRAIPGTGLGLAIVRTIVDNHGGQIMVRSREGEGTTVTVTIPLLPPEDSGAPPGQAAAGLAASAARAAGGNGEPR